MYPERNVSMSNEKLFAPLDQLLEEFHRCGIPGLDCIVYHRGKCVYRRYIGWRDEENKIPMDGTEQFFLYSASKPITCAAGLQLVEQGLLDLDSPLFHYMPEFAKMKVREGTELVPARNPILVRHLFSMSAGFTYQLDLPYVQRFRERTGGLCPTGRLGSFLAEEPLIFHPGTGWEYSMCHDVLAALIEKVSGQRFSDYVKEHIFRPLGMDCSSFHREYPHPERMAEQYEYRQNVRCNCGKFLQMCDFGAEYESGGAGCVSSTGDYIRFAEALRLGHGILKPESVDLLASDQTTRLDRHVFDDWGMQRYGYGMGVRCPREGYDTTDFGWDGVAGALMAVDRKYEYSMFYAQHVIGFSDRVDRFRLLPVIREACAQL